MNLGSHTPPDPRATLWAVTSYFNPAGYRNRLRNFHLFRRHLSVPLLAVELSFDGHFALRPGDADLLLRWNVGDVMWQKERLLNSAWDALPTQCEDVAWLDCDILFCDPDWPRHAQALLRDTPVVHGLRTLHHLPPEAPLHDLSRARGLASSVQHSVVQQRRAHAHANADLIGAALSRAHGAPTPGIAWIARRDWIRRVRLFDASIAGGGDTTFAAALLGQAAHAVKAHGMNPAQRAHYLAWADGLRREACDEPGVLAVDVLHLWHGELRHRQSSERHARLAASGFDPRHDLRAEAAAPWCWRDPRAPQVELLRRYFRDRHEDGADG